MKKTILGVLVLVPLMEALALAQVPTADAKEGKLYVEGGIGFGVASMAGPSTASKGFDAVPLFGINAAAEYGITEQFGALAKLGAVFGLSDDPGTTEFGLMFDGAYKFVEKKGDSPALTGYAGLGFVHLDIDPKGPGDDDSANFMFEAGVQADFGSDDLSFQPFMGFQLVGGSRPFKAYNGVLQVVAGAKVLYKLADNLYLEPSITFLGGNFMDRVMFGIGIQLRL